MSNSRTNKKCNTTAITTNNTTGRAEAWKERDIDRLMLRLIFVQQPFFFFIHQSCLQVIFYVQNTIYK